MGMGYEKFMAFTPVFPRNQLGGSKNLWVMTGSTVIPFGPILRLGPFTLQFWLKTFPDEA